MFPFKDYVTTLKDGVNKGFRTTIDESKATKAITISPSDTLTLEVTSGLYLGTSGDVSVMMKDGSNVIFKSLASGVIHPICVTKVKATGTTAANIVVVY